jgi:hypothetical protein
LLAFVDDAYTLWHKGQKQLCNVRDITHAIWSMCHVSRHVVRSACYVCEWTRCAFCLLCVCLAAHTYNQLMTVGFGYKACLTGLSRTSEF